MLAYINVDQRLHLLCQIQALVAANFIPGKADYKHTNLAFDPIGKRILTRWIKNDRSCICLALDLNSFSFQWIDEHLHLIHDINISGKRHHQLEAETISTLKQLGFASNVLKSTLKYDVPTYPFHDIPFEPFDAEALESWIRLRSLANQSCEDLLMYLNTKEEVRIWPHHFDTGIYKQLNHHLGIGFGLAMKDAIVGSPYFYMGGHGLQHEVAMTNLPELTLGSWKKGDWKGAVLPVSAIQHIEPENYLSTIHNFIITALKWYMTTSMK